MTLIHKSSREIANTYSFNDADQWLLTNAFNIDEVLAIVFLGRSGSVFLGSLLDNHPQIIMLPGTQLSFYYDFWESYGHSLQKDHLIKTFCAYFSAFFDVFAFSALSLRTQPALVLGFSEMGSERNEKIEVNKEKFIQVLHFILDKVSSVDRKSFFRAIHIAYTIASNRSSQLHQSKLPMIVYQLHMNWPPLVKHLISDFPKTKIIHMIREPFQTIGSHFKHSGYNCHVMNHFYNDAFLYGGKDRSRAIKLEDLHTEPKQTLEKIIKWIGIGWSDSLLESTFNGKKWWNLKDVEQVHGFNKVIISKNHSSFYYKFDEYRLNVLYFKRFKLWGYPCRDVSKLERFLILPLLLMPFKMELIYYRNDISSRKLVRLKNIIFDWVDPRRRRSYLVKAWRYSLSHELREVPLL